MSKYTLKDFYDYICSGDRPNGGGYYLGFFNDDEWQLQIYTGRTQVNFCRKDQNGIYNPVAAMLLDPDYNDIRCVQVYPSRGYADYDHPITYPMSYGLDDVVWNASFGSIGLTIKDVIERILDNNK